MTTEMWNDVCMASTIDVALLPTPSAARSRADAERLAPLLKALSDPTRLHLVMLLAVEPHTVRELTDATRLTQTLVSHHLAPLRDTGLVTVTPRGRANVYSLCCEALGDPVRALATVASTSPEGVDACCRP